MVNAHQVSKKACSFCKQEEQQWQFILDSRAMRQQIKTGISGEYEPS